jgi:hypothetical protein
VDRSTALHCTALHCTALHCTVPQGIEAPVIVVPLLLFQRSLLRPGPEISAVQCIAVQFAGKCSATVQCSAVFNTIVVMLCCFVLYPKFHPRSLVVY